MADLPVQHSSRSANDLSWAVPTPSTGDSFLNTGREALLVNNGGDANLNVTIETPASVDGLAIADRIVTVGPTSIALLGPFPRATYNDGEGRVNLVCSLVENVSLAVIKIAG